MLNYIYDIAKSIRDKISSLGEKGQGMVEYALILAVVAVIAAVVLNTSLTDSIKGAFKTADDNISAAAGEVTIDNAKGSGTSDP